MRNLSFFLLAAIALAPGCAGIEAAPKTPSGRLTAAARSGDAALVQKLLAEGVVPGEDEPTNILGDGLGWADATGHRAIFDMLLKRCAETYVPGKNCVSAPCYAASRGSVASLSAFLSRGLEVNADIMNSTPLGCAVSEGNAANAKLLIERGADVDQAISIYEASNVKLAAIPNTRDVIARQNAAIKMLERLRPGGKAAAAPAAGGLSRTDMEQIVKAAVATAKAPSAPEPVEIKSDVDRPAYTIATNPDAFAVVVGVEKYNALPDARFAERDARAMNAHLLAMGYPQRNVVLLTGPQATRTGIAKNVEAWLPNQVTERSTVLFYFSGHGAPDAKTSEAYLVPMDGDPQYLEETAYPIKRLYERLGALKAKRVLVALDSCFSGAGGRSVVASGTRPLLTKLTLAPAAGKVVSLSASSAEEITGALEAQGHGLFTYELLKALSETAGRGSVSELHDLLTPRVQDEARRQNRAQTPQMFGASVDGGLR